MIVFVGFIGFMGFEPDKLKKLLLKAKKTVFEFPCRPVADLIYEINYPPTEHIFR